MYVSTCSGMVGADLSLLPSYSTSPISSRLALIAGTSSCLMAVSLFLSPLLSLGYFTEVEPKSLMSQMIRVFSAVADSRPYASTEKFLVDASSADLHVSEITALECM